MYFILVCLFNYFRMQQNFSKEDLYFILLFQNKNVPTNQISTIILEIQLNTYLKVCLCICLMKGSSKMLQNLLTFWNKKLKKIFYIGYRDFCKKIVEKVVYSRSLLTFAIVLWRQMAICSINFLSIPWAHFHTYIHFLLFILQEEDLATTRITRSASGCAPPSTSAATTMRSCSIPSANRSMSSGSAKLRIIPNRGHCHEHSEVDEIETVLWTIVIYEDDISITIPFIYVQNLKK